VLWRFLGFGGILGAHGDTRSRQAGNQSGNNKKNGAKAHPGTRSASVWAQ